MVVRLKWEFDFAEATPEEMEEYANILLKLVIDAKNELEMAMPYSPLDEEDGTLFDEGKYSKGVKKAFQMLVEGLNKLAGMEE